MLNGEIWLANLNPGKGKEPGKVRPVLIVQGQALLDAKHPSTLIVPLTTQLTEDAEPLRLRVEAQGRPRTEGTGVELFLKREGNYEKEIDSGTYYLQTLDANSQECT